MSDGRSLFSCEGAGNVLSLTTLKTSRAAAASPNANAADRPRAATAVAHERDGHRELAAASRATSLRSAALCTALLERDMMAGLAEALRALYEAAAPRDDDLGELGEILGLSPFSENAASEVDEDWAAFLDKWRYGPDQRAAIRRTLYENWAPIVRKEVYSPIEE